MDRLFDAFDVPEPVPTSHSLFVGAFFGSYSVEDSSIDEKSHYISFEKSTDRTSSPGDETLLDISKFTPQESMDIPPSRTKQTARVTPELEGDTKDEPRFILRHISTENGSNVASDEEMAGFPRIRSKEPESPFIGKQARSRYDADQEKTSKVKESISFFENQDGSQSSRAKTIQTSNLFDDGLVESSPSRNTVPAQFSSPIKEKPALSLNLEREEKVGTNSLRTEHRKSMENSANGESSLKEEDASVLSRETASVNSRGVSTSSKTSKKSKSKKKERRSSRTGSVSSRSSRRKLETDEDSQGHSVDPSVENTSVRTSKSKKERRNSHDSSVGSRSSKSKKESKPSKRGKDGDRLTRKLAKDRPSLKGGTKSSDEVNDDFSSDSVRDHYETLCRSYILLGTPDSKISEGSCESEIALADTSNNYQLDDKNVKKRLLLSEVTPSKHSEGLAYYNGLNGDRFSSVNYDQVDELGFFVGSPIEKSDELCRIHDEPRLAPTDDVDGFISMEEGLHQLENIDDPQLYMAACEDPQDAVSCAYTNSSSLPSGSYFSIATQAREELGLGSKNLAARLATSSTMAVKQKASMSVSSERFKRETDEPSQKLDKIDDFDAVSDASHSSEKASKSKDSSFIKVAQDYVYPTSQRDYIIGSIACIFLILLVVILPITLTSSDDGNAQLASNVAPTFSPTQPATAPTKSPETSPSQQDPQYVFSHQAVWPDGNTGFGSSLAYDSGLLLIGMPVVDTVRTFTAKSGHVDLLGTVQGEQSGSGFGWSMAVASSTFMATGAPFLNAFASTRSVGGAYVFEYEDSSGTWRQFGPTIRGDEDTFAERENFGSAIGVTLLNDTLRVAIGAPRSSLQYLYDVGRIYTFERSVARGGDWNKIEENALNGLGTGDRFGSSVGISKDGTILVAGAPGSLLHEDAGYVLGYRYFESEKWVPIFTLSGVHSDEEFGASISILSDTGDTIAVGAPAFNENSGRVAVYRLNREDRYERLGNDIIGSFGERVGDKNSLDGSQSENGLFVVVATATGIIKRYEYDEAKGDWIHVYKTLDTEFDGVTSLACQGKDCHSMAAGSLSDRSVSLFQSSEVEDRL
ncbi:hypothetical protein FisN_7Lh100 [Fistulifera solaris]|uniref:Uncharacterized protein n=1 Tax=Fistulifera solaris TaxID=1519565 RepID=A0A1Z5JCP6_FISSO|nr:hypothetical protein FisN_7Lh100 [Fistulifera solaris]|eukprot:GAX11726.1 hypothetical protein FisN_7Lh100 [Fistulifera solaris]